jgi:hypothetical protein
VPGNERREEVGRRYCYCYTRILDLNAFQKLDMRRERLRTISEILKPIGFNSRR